MPVAHRTEESPWRAGWDSARLLFRPGLALQALAVALVLAYYFVPPARRFFECIAAWRAAGGYLFSAGLTALCGGVLPFLYLRWNPVTRAAHPWSQLAFFALFWTWKGAEVDLLYRSLAWLLGHAATLPTVAAKVALDQLGYNPFYATPIGILCYAWKDAGFRWTPVARDLGAGRWYLRRVVPAQLAVWCVWLPVVSCVYSLPSPLQIPLFNIVLCFWSLLFAHLTSRQNRSGVVFEAAAVEPRLMN